MSNRPWSPGPWRDQIGRNDVLAEGELVSADNLEVCWFMNHGDLPEDVATEYSRITPGIEVGDANIALIALSPEMAEAILNVCDEADQNNGTASDEAVLALHRVADELRSIGRVEG